MPDNEKSCFACCPPIRPKGYEHIQYKNIIKRILRENTSSFVPAKRFITGYSCWALGYLDRRFKLVGCLLHPARNNGVDSRYLTGYGDKCRREYCLEAKIFSELNHKTKMFLLSFSEGMDSFLYSSRTRNPLFRLLRWGKYILELISKEEPGRISLTQLNHRYPFLKVRMNPRAVAYLVKEVLKKGHIPDEEEVRASLLKAKTLAKHISFCSERYTHLLPMDRDFLDFVRLGLGIKKIGYEEAMSLKVNISSYL
jgi:hypothetical protein